MYGRNEQEGLMKTLSSICDNALDEMKCKSAVLCDYVMTPSGCYLLEDPVMSSEYSCGYCKGVNHYSPYFDPAKSQKRVWLCANTNCDVYKKKLCETSTSIQPNQKRALEWPEFCEINGIGDLHHGVKFEKIEQTSAKIDYLFKFANQPVGIIFMQGTPGSGKTYSCLGVCELFTRKNASARFITQTKMQDQWMSIDKYSFSSQMECVKLLVIDDFGTGEVPQGFMKFLLDLINTRMQWSDRGTIITTNLGDKDFSIYCGNALNDRIGTGQKMLFKEKSRRKQNIL